MKQFKQFFLILCLTIVGGVSNAWAQYYIEVPDDKVETTYKSLVISGIGYECRYITTTHYFKDNCWGIEFLDSTITYSKIAYVTDFYDPIPVEVYIPDEITVADATHGDVRYEVVGFLPGERVIRDYSKKIEKLHITKRNFPLPVNPDFPTLNEIYFEGKEMSNNDYSKYNVLTDLYFANGRPTLYAEQFNSSTIGFISIHIAGMTDEGFQNFIDKIDTMSPWSSFWEVVKWENYENNDPEAPEYVKMNLTLKGPSLSMDAYGGVEDINVLHDNYAKEDPLTVTSVLCRKGYQFRFKCSTIIKDSYCLKRVVVNGYDILSEIEGRCTEIPYIVNYGSDDEVNIVVETECYAPAVEIISTDGGTLSWTDRNGNAKSLTEDGKSTLRIDKDSPIIVTITPDEGSILQGVSSIFSEGSYFNSNDYSLELYDDFIAVLVQMGQTEEAAHEQMLNSWGLKKLADGSWQMAVSSNSSDSYAGSRIVRFKTSSTSPAQNGITFNISRSGGGVAAYSALESTYTAIEENNLSRQIIDGTHGDITFSAIANADEKVTFYVNGEAVNPEDVASWVSESDVFVNDGALQTEYKNKTNYQLSYNYEDMIAAGASNGDVLNLNIVTEKIPHIFVNATVEGLGKNTVLCNQNPHIADGDAGTYVYESNTANVNTFINPATESGSFIGLYATPYKGQTVEVSVNGAELELTKKVADGPLAIPDWNSDWTENNVIPYEEGDTYYHLENYRITPGETYNVKVKYSYQPNYLLSVTRIGGAEVSASRWTKVNGNIVTTDIDDKETLPVELYSECLADEGSQKHLCMEFKKNDGEILKLFLDGVDITDQLELSADTNKYIWNFSIPSEQVDTQQHSLVFYSVPAGSADVNGDGAVNIADVTALVNNILGKQ